MQGDLEETVGIGERTIPRRLWEAEIVLRCAAWVAGIHGATLLGLSILTEVRVSLDVFLSMRMERILAGAAMLGASALILRRRGRLAIVSAAALHFLYMQYLAAVVISFLAAGGSFSLLEIPMPRLLHALLAILLAAFIALAALGRSAEEAFSPALRGTPLAPISSCLQVGASARAWAALVAVGLSYVYLAQLLVL